LQPCPRSGVPRLGPTAQHPTRRLSQALNVEPWSVAADLLWLARLEVGGFGASTRGELLQALTILRTTHMAGYQSCSVTLSSVRAYSLHARATVLVMAPCNFAGEGSVAESRITSDKPPPLHLSPYSARPRWDARLRW
jgi:hypothetical protein